jgi:HYR domain-containing protein
VKNESPLGWPAQGLVALALLGAASAASAQVHLVADGQTDTYALINSVLAPKRNALETPDCLHPEFGPHVSQVFDDDLRKPVFVFHMHTDVDGDTCARIDRQRNEIKTYGPSPAYVKGFFGDAVTYRWRFKLDASFQPSSNFTHIHQIKAGDGSNSGAPTFTLTPRSGSPERLELIWVNSAGTTSKVQTVPLAGFKGEWVEAYEKLTYTDPGSYSIEIRRLRDRAMLLSYSNDNIETWRTGGTTFVRPKWGIYRSLNNIAALRNEQVRFDDFCLAKGADDCPADTEPPVLSLPADLTVEATGPEGAVVTFSGTARDDRDGDVPVTFSPGSGTTFPLGPTTVTATAVDRSGNEASGSFRVTVRDTTAPTIETLTATPNALWPPNHIMVPIAIASSATDLVDPQPVIRILAVASSEAEDGSGDGDTAPDWEIFGPLAVNLRAERAGGEPGRIYAITVAARDTSGNTSTRTVNVVVPASQGKSK